MTTHNFKIIFLIFLAIIVLSCSNNKCGLLFIISTIMIIILFNIKNMSENKCDKNICKKSDINSDYTPNVNEYIPIDNKKIINSNPPPIYDSFWRYNINDNDINDNDDNNDIIDKDVNNFNNQFKHQFNNQYNSPESDFINNTNNFRQNLTLSFMERNNKIKKERNKYPIHTLYR